MPQPLIHNCFKTYQLNVNFKRLRKRLRLNKVLNIKIMLFKIY